MTRAGSSTIPTEPIALANAWGAESAGAEAATTAPSGTIWPTSADPAVLVQDEAGLAAEHRVAVDPLLDPHHPQAARADALAEEGEAVDLRAGQAVEGGIVMEEAAHDVDPRLALGGSGERALLARNDLGRGGEGGEPGGRSRGRLPQPGERLAHRLHLPGDLGRSGGWPGGRGPGLGQGLAQLAPAVHPGVEVADSRQRLARRQGGRARKSQPECGAHQKGRTQAPLRRCPDHARSSCQETESGCRMQGGILPGLQGSGAGSPLPGRRVYKKLPVRLPYTNRVFGTRFPASMTSDPAMRQDRCGKALPCLQERETARQRLYGVTEYGCSAAAASRIADW